MRRCRHCLQGTQRHANPPFRCCSCALQHFVVPCIFAHVHVCPRTVQWFRDSHLSFLHLHSRRESTSKPVTEQSHTLAPSTYVCHAFCNTCSATGPVNAQPVLCTPALHMCSHTEADAGHKYQASQRGLCSHSNCVYHNKEDIDPPARSLNCVNTNALCCWACCPTTCNITHPSSQHVLQNRRQLHPKRPSKSTMTKKRTHTRPSPNHAKQGGIK